MWVSIAACTWLEGRLLTQDGSWLCHTRLWPRTRSLCALANATIWSPGPKLNEPLDGSVVSHFISLPGVTMSNWVPATPVRVELLRLLTTRAVPKYLPFASASCRSGVPAAAAGTAVAATPSAVAVIAALAASMASLDTALRRRGSCLGMLTPVSFSTLHLL